MLKRLNGCTMGCDLPCIREACPYWGGFELYCDECGEETDELYALDGQQLCEDCLKKQTKIKSFSEDDYDD